MDTIMTAVIRRKSKEIQGFEHRGDINRRIRINREKSQWKIPMDKKLNANPPNEINVSKQDS